MLYYLLSYLDKYFAINVLKSILQKDKEMLDKYIRPMIDNLINSYYQNPKKNWMDKIIAINLIFGSMIKTYAAKCKTEFKFIKYNLIF